MMPRLQAEEAFAAAERVAVGSGSLEPRASREITSRWTRTIDGDRRIGQPAVKASPRTLGLLGIGMRRVPRQAPTS